MQLEKDQAELLEAILVMMGAKDAIKAGHGAPVAFAFVLNAARKSPIEKV